MAIPNHVLKLGLQSVIFLSKRSQIVYSFAFSVKISKFYKLFSVSKPFLFFHQCGTGKSKIGILFQRRWISPFRIAFYRLHFKRYYNSCFASSRIVSLPEKRFHQTNKIKPV